MLVPAQLPRQHRPAPLHAAPLCGRPASGCCAGRAGPACRAPAQSPRHTCQMEGLDWWSRSVMAGLDWLWVSQCKQVGGSSIHTLPTSSGRQGPADPPLPGLPVVALFDGFVSSGLEVLRPHAPAHRKGGDRGVILAGGSAGSSGGRRCPFHFPLARRHALPSTGAQQPLRAIQCVAAYRRAASCSPGRCSRAPKCWRNTSSSCSAIFRQTVRCTGG